jgi:hypothetical protein
MPAGSGEEEEKVVCGLVEVGKRRRVLLVRKDLWAFLRLKLGGRWAEVDPIYDSPCFIVSLCVHLSSKLFIAMVK